MEKNKIDYFKIVKEFIKIAVYERKFNPFHFNEIEEDICYFYGKEKIERKNYLELRNKNILEYKKFLNWYVKSKKYDFNMFKRELRIFCFYSYAIINNKIINDNRMKKKNGDFLKYNTEHYHTKFQEVLNDWNLIFIDDLQENEIPYKRNGYIHKYLQDKKGNYILPRIEEEFNINSYYNVSNYFLKK